MLRAKKHTNPIMLRNLKHPEEMAEGTYFCHTLYTAK
jgi:hypothetical protein